MSSETNEKPKRKNEELVSTKLSKIKYQLHSIIENPEMYGVSDVTSLYEMINEINDFYENSDDDLQREATKPLTNREVVAKLLFTIATALITVADRNNPEQAMQAFITIMFCYVSLGTLFQFQALREVDYNIDKLCDRAMNRGVEAQRLIDEAQMLIA